MQNQSLKNGFTITAIIVGLFGLILQFALMLQTRQTEMPEAIVRFFSFFTILSNCLVVLFFMGSLLPGRKTIYDFVNKDEVATAISIYIIVVGVVYQTVLRKPVPLEGWNRLADDILHAFIPLLMLVYWILFISSKKINIKTIPYWLIYPSLYLAYTLIRGSYVNYYPYPFVEVNKLGYGRVFLNSGMLVVVFLGLSLLFATYANIRYKNKTVSKP